MNISNVDCVPLTKENIDKVLEFLPYFEDRTNEIFEYVSKREIKSGIFHITNPRVISLILYVSSKCKTSYFHTIGIKICHIY